MNRWFVYYRDGYPDDGDEGFVGFQTQSEALDFINRRVEPHKSDSSDYRLIEGREYALADVAHVTRIEIAK